MPVGTIYGEIEAKRASILKTWRASFGYEAGSNRSSAVQNSSSFTDSIAYLVNEGTNDVLTWLVNEDDDAEIPESLTDLCRMKAIQDAHPSQTLGFVFELKRAIRSALNISDKKVKSAELAQVDERIDQLALFTFDRYAEFREKIYQIKVAELQRGEGFAQRRQAVKHGSRERETV